MFGWHLTTLVRPSLLMFHIIRAIARINSWLVFYRVPRSGSLTLAKNIVFAWTQEKTTTLGGTEPIILHDNAWESGFLICSKTLMELIFNPWCEFRRSSEGPVSQIHSPHLQAGAPENFSDLIRSVQMLKREVGCGKQRVATEPIHT